MIRLEFNQETIKDLDYQRYHYPHPRVQRKMEAVYLKSQGVSHQDIKRLVRISENTLLNYLRRYQTDGIEGLKEIRFRKPVSELAEHKQTLETYFVEHPPATVKEAAAKIEQLTGIRRTPERVRIFMKKLGLKPRKVGMIPAKADVLEQEKFLTEQLQPRISEAQAGKRTLFLAAHFVLAPFLGILWN